MSSSREADYFTKHLFQAGLECPTKLFYKAESYPENKQSLPFIEHAIYNKRLLKSLARSPWPEGILINNSNIEDAAGRTRRLLESDSVVLFDAIFTHKRMMAKLPIVVRSGNELTVYHIQLKAFNPKKKQLINQHGNIYSKWEDYLLQFAYQLYIIKQNHPGFGLNPVLVLPNKMETGQAGDLHFKLYSNYKKENPDIEIPATEQELLAKIDVRNEISLIWNDKDFAEKHFGNRLFEDTLDNLKRLYFTHTRQTPEIGTKCKQCEFRIEPERKMRDAASGFDACWRSHFPKTAQTGTLPHVFDLIGPGTAMWIDRGIYDQRNISSDEVIDPQKILKGEGRISEQMRQALQIARVKGLEVPEEIIRPELYEELERWRYPIHFLDFEAGNYAVPVRNNRRPYHLVVFQFSCHTLSKDGTLTHYEWLDDRKSGYPNYELVRQLQRIPGIEDGTIVQYSNFERNALKTIRRELVSEAEQVKDADELRRWIGEIIRRNDSSSIQPPYISDLSRLVKNYYYNNRMVNSLSIKDVLQSVLSYSSLLKEKYSEPYSSSNFEEMVWWQPDGSGQARNPYQILAENTDRPVRRGTEAMVVYGKMLSCELNAKEMEALRQPLLKYCELDTLAMLMIFEHWEQKLKEFL